VLKKKWICKSSNFLNQIIKKDLEGFDGSEDKSSESGSASSSDKSETETSESKEEEEGDDGEVSKFRIAEYGLSKMMKVDKKKTNLWKNWWI